VTVISSIITDAFREGNILPLGKEPTTLQAGEALRLINQLFKAVYGDEAGEGLTDWPLGDFGQVNPFYTIPDDQRRRPTINKRLVAINEAAIDVYLPVYPQDGARMGIADPYGRLATVPVTLNGNGRRIEDQAYIVLNENGMSREWFYRADLGQWVRLTSKIATDEMPFPDDFDIFFTILLALRLNPRYGREMDAQSQAIFKGQKQSFVARYAQAMPLQVTDDISWPFMSTQSYNSPSVFASNDYFSSGQYPWGTNRG